MLLFELFADFKRKLLESHYHDSLHPNRLQKLEISAKTYRKIQHVSTRLYRLRFGAFCSKLNRKGITSMTGQELENITVQASDP